MTGQTVELRTDRLLLRPFHVEDVDDVYEYARDPEWGRFLPVRQPYTRKDAETFVAQSVLTDWESRPMWALVKKSNVVGAIGLHVRAATQVAELGFSIGKSQWGKGLVVEAAEAVLDWGFEKRGLAKIFATADVRNSRSQRVQEKLGMRREGVLRSHVGMRDGRADHVYYGILREEWGEL